MHTDEHLTMLFLTVLFLTMLSVTRLLVESSRQKFSVLISMCCVILSAVAVTRLGRAWVTDSSLAKLYTVQLRNERLHALLHAAISLLHG